MIYIFFCITFLLRHVILFLIKPRQIRPGKLGFWCDIVCQFGGGGGGYIRQACSPLIQLFFGFASDIDQTNINRDIRDGNWLSSLESCCMTLMSEGDDVVDGAQDQDCTSQSRRRERECTMFIYDARCKIAPGFR